MRPRVASQTAAHLKTLDLSHNKLETLSGQALGDYLLVATSLRDLDVSWNNLHGKVCGTNAWAAAAVSALVSGRVRPVARELTWYDPCAIDQGALALAHAMGTNAGLRKLKLAHNRFADAAAQVSMRATLSPRLHNPRLTRHRYPTRHRLWGWSCATIKRCRCLTCPTTGCRVRRQWYAGAA